MQIAPATRFYIPDRISSKHVIQAEFPFELFKVIQWFQEDIIQVIQSNMNEFIVNTNNAFKQEFHWLLELKNVEWTKHGITQFGVSFSLSEEAMVYVPYEDLNFIDILLQEKQLEEDSNQLAFQMQSWNIQDIQSAFMLESIVNRYIHEILSAETMQNFKL